MALSTGARYALAATGGFLFAGIAFNSCGSNRGNTFEETLEGRVRTAATTGNLAIKSGFRLDKQARPTNESIAAAKDHAYDNIGVGFEDQPNARQQAVISCGFVAVNLALSKDAAAALSSAFNNLDDAANETQRDQAFGQAAHICDQQLENHLGSPLALPVNQE